MSKNVPVVNHKIDTIIKISASDLNKIHKIGEELKEQNITIYLPSINKEIIGSWVEIIKLNKGYILFKTSDEDKIASYFKSNCVHNFTRETGSSIKFKVIDSTTWQFETSDPSRWRPEYIEKPYFPEG